MKKQLAAAALLWTTVAACAQGWPARPVTLVVPFPPGGGTDTGASIVAQKLSLTWGQQVVVENKGGAAGQIGADLVAKAKPDGYTILMGNVGTQSINPSLYAKKARLIELGGVPHATTPAQFAPLIDTDRKRYAQIIRERKITLD